MSSRKLPAPRSCELCGKRIEDEKYHIIAFYNPTAKDGWRAHNVCPPCLEKAKKHEFDKGNWTFREEVSKEDMTKIYIAFKKLMENISADIEVKRAKALLKNVLGD